MGCCAVTGEDDRALLERYLRDGDEQAITILYLRYQGALHAYARRMLGDEAGAGDLVQDAWEAVLTYRDLASAAGHFRGFIFRVAHNLVRRGFQTRGRERRYLAAFAWAGARLQTDGCAYCDRPARNEGGLCPAHARRRARGATEAEMNKPIRAWRKKR